MDDARMRELASKDPALYALMLILAKEAYDAVPEEPIPGSPFLRDPKEEAVLEAVTYLKNRPVREERSKIFLSKVRKIMPQAFDSSGELIDPNA
ncbi:MAG: hypothetical protein CME70_13700 [Halobacteriovorax sp.]|nr:hypothetical protein [Halobacteriovorax sp.]MBK25047.1 hypothetical protein [Halobacteriovorax sp.]|tara:strand:- start:1014 stop:1295 length:282 start_codon:yes stop_codon:yes gene_type:complete